MDLQSPVPQIKSVTAVTAFENLLGHLGLRIAKGYAPCIVYLYYIWAMYGVNVGKCSIHGAYGNMKKHIYIYMSVSIGIEPGGNHLGSMSRWGLQLCFLFSGGTIYYLCVLQFCL